MDCIIFVPKELEELSLQKELLWTDHYNDHFFSDIPFMYESAYLHGVNTIKPWESMDKTVPIIMRNWEAIKKELHEHYSKRQKNESDRLMKKGLALFIEMLYWSNNLPAFISQIEPQNLKLKPVNIQERLQYISTNNRYHSFIQLSGLFTEMEKIFRKELAINSNR